MYRGTTPSFRFALSAETAAELANYYITFAQNGKELFTITNEQCRLETDGDTACIAFSIGQDKTLKMQADVDVEIQIRAVTMGGTATASPVVTRPVFEILHDGYID